MTQRKAQGAKQPERRQIKTQWGIVPITKTKETREVTIGGKSSRRVVWRDHRGMSWVHLDGHWWRVRDSRFLGRTICERDERF